MLEIDPHLLEDRLRSSLNVTRWVNQVISSAPFSSQTDLMSTASDAATPLSATEIDEALAAHGPIGDTTTGTDREQRFGQGEQSGIDRTDRRLTDALAEGNAIYEKRFGRMFLIRATGRTGQEVLTAMHERLLHDDRTELDTTANELREIALLRLESLFPRD